MVHCFFTYKRVKERGEEGGSREERGERGREGGRERKRKEKQVRNSNGAAQHCWLQYPASHKKTFGKVK